MKFLDAKLTSDDLGHSNNFSPSSSVFLASLAAIRLSSDVSSTSLQGGSTTDFIAAVVVVLVLLSQSATGCATHRTLLT